MTLGFKQEIAGEPTYFAEKIISGLPLEYEHQFMTLNDSLADVVEPTSEQFDKGSCNPLFNHQPKLHTIREDVKGLWSAGKLIHPVINNRTANRYQFAPTMPCVSVQLIEIWHRPEDADPRPWVFVDKVSIMQKDVQRLAINDGFESVEAFYSFFNKDFRGKIIHWTNLQY